MEGKGQVKDMPAHIRKIRAQVARISASEDVRQHAMRLITEILEASNSVITIDTNDIRDSLGYEGTLAVYDISVSAKKAGRMKELIERIGRQTADSAPIKSLLFHLFFPKELPLQMSELQPLSDWLSSIESDSDFAVRWGMAATRKLSEPLLRAVMLVVTA